MANASLWPLATCLAFLSIFGHETTVCPKPPQYEQPRPPFCSLGSSSIIRTGGIRWRASLSRCLRSKRHVSSQLLLMNVVATPVLPHRPVRPILFEDSSKLKNKAQQTIRSHHCSSLTPVYQISLRHPVLQLTGEHSFLFRWACQN